MSGYGAVQMWGRPSELDSSRLGGSNLEDGWVEADFQDEEWRARARF